MKRFVIAAALALAAVTAALAAENQAFLGLFVETKVMKMAGMPAIELPAGVDVSQIPGMAGLMGMGAPQRALTVRLWSPGIAPEDASAEIAPPAGLKQGEKIELELYRPKPGQVEGGTEGGEGGAATPPDFTIKRYWGSSETVKAGQPEVFTFDKLTPEQKAAMREASAKAQKQESYFYKPDWTTGYWPTKKQPGQIAKDAALAGKYSLTSYAGNVAIDVPDTVDFLAPIDLTSPDLKKRPDLGDAITVRWKPVPNILGTHAQIMGMQGRKTLILWSSSEVRDEFGTDYGFLQMAQVKDFVQQTVFMAPDRGEVVVPAGIFKECDMVFMTMVGYGPGVALAEAQPLPRVQTKTSLQVMLGGKQMPDMGDMGDAGDEGE